MNCFKVPEFNRSPHFLIWIWHKVLLIWKSQCICN